MKKMIASLLCMVMLLGINSMADKEAIKAKTIGGVDPNLDHKITADQLNAYYEECRNDTEMQEDILKGYLKHPEVHLSLSHDNDQLSFGEYVYYDKKLCDIARNEIYARHGYIFSKKEYQDIFKTKSWYKPVVKDINQIKLSKIEQNAIEELKWWSEVGDDFRNKEIPEGAMDHYFFDINEKFSMDLNGDGIKEEIESTGDQIKINGIVKATIPGCKSGIRVIDADPTDSYKELIVNARKMEESDERVASYYYDGKDLKFMGQLIGEMEYGPGLNYCYYYMKDQLFYSGVGSGNVGPWIAYMKSYKLTELHTWEPVSEHAELPHVEVMTAKEIMLYQMPNNQSKAMKVKGRTKLTLVASDLTSWVKLRTADGSEGWFYTGEDHAGDLLGIVTGDPASGGWRSGE